MAPVSMSNGTEKEELVVLLGSNNLDALIDIGGVMTQLGEIVARSQKDSHLSPARWNDLSAEARDEKLQKTVQVLREEAEEKASTVEEPTDTVSEPASQSDAKVHMGRGLGGSYVSLGGGERVRVAELSTNEPGVIIQDDGEL